MSLNVKRERAKRLKVGPREQAFSLLELITAIGVLGILVSAGVIAWNTATHNTDVRAAAEMLKEDIRKVRMMTEAGDRYPKVNGIPTAKSLPDRYYIYFYGPSDTTAGRRNSYRIRIYRCTGTDPYTYAWQEVAPPRGTYQNMQLISGVYYIKPSRYNNDIALSWNLQYLSSGNPTNSTSLCFMKYGSNVRAMPAATTNYMGTPEIGDMTITIAGNNISKTIRISRHGSVSDL